MSAISVTMSVGAADGLKKAIDRYRPRAGERDRLHKSRKWLNDSLKGQKGSVTLVAKQVNLLWLAECVAQPGMGYAAAAAIISAIASAGQYEPPEASKDEEARVIRRAIENGEYDGVSEALGELHVELEK